MELSEGQTVDSVSSFDRQNESAIKNQQRRLNSSEWVWKLWEWPIYLIFPLTTLMAIGAFFESDFSHFILLMWTFLGLVAGIGLSFGIGHMIDQDRLRKTKELRRASITSWRYVLLVIYLCLGVYLVVQNFDYLSNPAEAEKRQQHDQPIQDPRFSTCKEAISRGYGPYFSGFDTEYGWYIDRDSDGIVCER